MGEGGPAIITPGDVGSPTGGIPPGGGNGDPGPGLGGGGVEPLTLGLDRDDRRFLQRDTDTLHHAQQLYSYARALNHPIRREFNLMIDFTALGKQFLKMGNDLNHLARPKRNVTFDIVRHKTGLVTEPPTTVEALPRGPDDGDKAQLAKGVLEFNAERVERRRKLDRVVRWAAFTGTGLMHQGWDPVSQNTQERVVDPRLFDPDPDHPEAEHWLYCFETLRLPIETIKALFPATGWEVGPDDAIRRQEGVSQPPQMKDDMLNIRVSQGSGQTGGYQGKGPDYASIVLYWSKGHFLEHRGRGPRPAEVMSCDVCGGTFEPEPASPDATFDLGLPVGTDLLCPRCGLGTLTRNQTKAGRLVPLYPKGRRLVVFAPHAGTLLYKGKWPTDELIEWPYKFMRWYHDPRRWWGIGEPQHQWSLQLLANKMLVMLADNAAANATPKVILPKGIGFEHKRWTNLPSEKLIAKDPRLIGQIRSFQTGDVGQSLLFLMQFSLNQLREQGGFQDVALGQMRASSEISGRAIERAQAAAEVPVRDHLRQRYEMETGLFREDFRMIKKRWKRERAVRLLRGIAENEVVWLKGDDLPEVDVVITSDPQVLIDRSQRADVAIKLMQQPDPTTGMPMLDAQAVAEWVGVPTTILRGMKSRQMQAQMAANQQGAGGPAGPAGAGPAIAGNVDLAQAVQQMGIAQGLGPEA